MHHIISDAWSLGIIFREIGALYQAYIRDEPSPSRICRFSTRILLLGSTRRLQGRKLERELGYWREQLKGMPPALELLTDRPRPPVQSTRGAKQSTVIPKPGERWS